MIDHFIYFSTWENARSKELQSCLLDLLSYGDLTASLACGHKHKLRLRSAGQANRNQARPTDRGYSVMRRAVVTR